MYVVKYLRTLDAPLPDVFVAQCNYDEQAMDVAEALALAAWTEGDTDGAYVALDGDGNVLRTVPIVPEARDGAQGV